MNEVWNSWDLKPPPTCTVKMVLHHKEMRKLTELIFEASRTLTELKCLNSEAAILSRFLYKNKRRFRLDKAFQNLSKIYQCLKRYLKLDLRGTMQAFKATLPKEIKSIASHAYLPTRQMLKWLLLRLMAFSQIFARIINLSVDAGAHVHTKFHFGLQRNLCLIIYSLTARILAVSKFLVLKSIEWYNALHKNLLYLEETAKFVPEFIFPVDLRKWLGNVDVSPLQEKTPIDEVFEGVDLIEDESDMKIVSEDLFKNFRVDVTEDSDVEEVPSEEVNQVSAGSVEDLGVPVKEEEEKKEKDSKMMRQKRKEMKVRKKMKTKNKNFRKVRWKPWKKAVKE